MKQKILTIAKICLSAIFLFFILRKINFQEIFTIIFDLDRYWLVFGILLSFVNMLILSIRPIIILDANNRGCLKVVKSYLYYLYGAFYSNFLPSLIGGDAFRIYYISKNGSSILEASATVILERVSGLLIMITLASSSIFIVFPHKPFGFFAMVGLVLIYIVFGIVLFYQRTVCFFEELIIKDTVIGNVLHKLLQFIKVIQSFASKKKVFMLVIILTLAIQAIDIFVIYIYGLSIHIKIPFYYFVAFIPIVYLITLIPVSINGLGLREGIVVLLFSKAGVPESQALVLSFLMYFDNIVKGIAGGLLLLFGTLKDLRLKVKRNLGK